jgi:Kef-type K+ transport system membrane component KefB
MIFNLPISVVCVLSMFYGYGMFALIAGKAWNRWTGKIIRGAPARLGGVALIGIGVLFTLLIYHPEREGEIAATTCLWIATLVFVGWMIRQQEERRDRLPRIPLERKSKRKRKNTELH